MNWNTIFAHIAGNMAACICFVIAGVLAYKGLSGWGWFLIAGCLVVK